jgi:hypothetical protein
VATPVVARVSSASGPVAGSGFTSATGVSFGRVAATNLVVADDTADRNQPGRERPWRSGRDGHHPGRDLRHRQMPADVTSNGWS